MFERPYITIIMDWLFEIIERQGPKFFESITRFWNGEDDAPDKLDEKEEGDKGDKQNSKKNVN